MSDRAISEAVTNIYNDVHEIGKKQNELKNEIVKLSTDIGWIKEGISELDKKLSNCLVCRNPEELLKKVEDNKKYIRELRDSQSSIKYTAIGVSAGISIIITIILFILTIKGTI